MNVLYVEDSASDADFTRIEVRRYNPASIIEVAANLAEARRHLSSGRAFDVLLVDLRLPDGNGLDLVREVRSSGLAVAVVVLTSAGDEQTAVAALKAGADDYVAKRDSYVVRLPATLDATIRRFRAERARWAGTLRVLYAEHHAADVALTQHHLSKHAPHVRLEVLHSGEEVLNRLPRSAGEPCLVDVVLLDYHLPGDTALDILKVIREDRGLDLAVVLVTGQGDEEIAARALRLGASDYVVKNPGYLYALPAALENAQNRVLLAREQAALHASEARLMGVILSATDAILSVDAERRVVLFNPAAERMFRCASRDAIGNSIDRFLPGGSLLPPATEVGAVSAEPRLTTLRGQRADGEEFPVEASIACTQAAGKVLYTLILRDVTQRERAQEELRESEERFRQITEHIDEVFWMTDPAKSAMLYVSPAYEAIWGRTRESLYAHPRKWLDAAHGEDRDRLEEATRTRQADGSYDEQYRVVRPDGSVRWVRDRAFPVRNRSGELYRIVGVAQDVTVQKQTQEALRHSEEKFSKAFQSSPDALVLARLSDGVLVEVNEVFLRVSGYTRAQALGHTTAELRLWVDPADRARYLSALERDGVVRDQPASFRGASGESHDGLVSGEIIQLEGERLALTTIRDVTEINKIQQRLMSIYDTVGDVVFLVAVEGEDGFRFESVNKRFSATTGLPAEAVVGKRLEEVVPRQSLPLVLSRYRQAIREKGVVRWEETSDYPAGRRSGEVSIAPILDRGGKCTHLVGAVHDITERKAAEERQASTEEMLRQSQKLEGIGRLAGGIAHDFNNILGVILGYGELMRSQLAESQPARARLELMIQAAQRAAGLTRQLLAFSRKQVMQPKLLDLGAVVHDIRRMLERVVGEDLEIVVDCQKGLGAVQADPTQIEQVLMNLVVNARDAMPKGGDLTIETANVQFDESYATAHPPAQAGAFVMLAVSDTGLGMSAETQARIFEPFFTTKPPGEGTGLGLSTVYGIVKQMGGYIWVYSEVGHGTTFRIYLPRVAEGVAAASNTEAAQPLPGGDETVLMVEDSESLRDLIKELLEERGYMVISATNGEEALTLARERGDDIDLLLTDVVMPKLGGGDLVKRVRALWPGIRVLYMSGYTSGAILRQGVLEKGINLLEKPFTGEQLARAVRKALSEPIQQS